MPKDRYPEARGIPAKYDALDVGNIAPLPDGPSLEPGRLLNLHHLWGNELGTAVMEPISIVASYGGTKATTAVKEAIDATVVAISALDTGAIQVFNGAIRKASSATIASAFAFAAWPTYKIEAGTITTLGGLRVYGVQEASGGTVTDFAGVQIDATALLYTNWYGISVGAKTGAAGTINAAAAFSQPVGAAFNAALLLAKSTVSPTMTFQALTTGLLTVTCPDSVTSYTLTLPPDDGDVGEQLQTNGSGVTTWEDPATSTRAVKILEGVLDPEVALDRVRNTTVHLYHYDPEAKHVGGDYTTQFAHLVLEEAPWAARANKRSTAVLSELGHHNAAITALANRLEAVEAKVA